MGLRPQAIAVMRVLFALPGLYKYDRGAEIAFIAIARELAKAGDTVTLVGSGHPRASEPFRFVHAGSLGREHFALFPSPPVLRNDTAYEELTFAPGLLRHYRPADYDITLTCSYPFTNWILRRGTRRPPHVFVTQNGDWPATANNSEYRYFGCEGLVCTNPDFYERNSARWRCALIPNGIDTERFFPGPSDRPRFGIPDKRMIVLMVSALIESKRVDEGIAAVSKIPDAHLVVAGDGPLRHRVEATAAEKMPGRFTLLSLAAHEMPSLYRSADVFLHLSKEEAFGNVFLEAMASGLPIVGHDSARLRWITGDGEFLVNTEDRDAVTNAIKAAASAPKERSATRVGRATEFSWNKVGTMYREFLRQVVEAAR